MFKKYKINITKAILLLFYICMMIENGYIILADIITLVIISSTIVYKNLIWNLIIYLFVFINFLSFILNEDIRNTKIFAIKLCLLIISIFLFLYQFAIIKNTKR